MEGGGGQRDRQTDGHMYRFLLYSTGHSPLWDRCPKRRKIIEKELGRKERIEKGSWKINGVTMILLAERNGKTIYAAVVKGKSKALSSPEMGRVIAPTE